jgi:DNA-binding transcriptional MerR regulator
MGCLKIGEVARLFGISPDIIRWYERERLLPPIQRTLGGYRLYGDAALKRLGLIRRALHYGLTLGDVRLLIGLDGVGPELAAVAAARCLRGRVTAIAQKVAALLAAQQRLEEVIRTWQRRPKATGSILERVVDLGMGSGRGSLVEGARQRSHGRRLPRPIRIDAAIVPLHDWPARPSSG